MPQGAGKSVPCLHLMPLGSPRHGRMFAWSYVSKMFFKFQKTRWKQSDSFKMQIEKMGESEAKKRKFI